MLLGENPRRRNAQSQPQLRGRPGVRAVAYRRLCPARRRRPRRPTRPWPGRETHVVADRNDPLPALVRERAQQGAALDPIRDRGATRPAAAVTFWKAVEAAVEALASKAPVEVEQCLAVGVGRRPQTQSSAIAEDHASTDSPRSCRHGSIRAPGRSSVRTERQRAGRMTRSPSGCRGCILGRGRRRAELLGPLRQK